MSAPQAALTRRRGESHPMTTATGSQPLDAHPANPVLSALAQAIHAIQRQTADPAHLAAASARTLRLFLGHPQLLHDDQRQSDPERYRQHVLYVADDGAFSIVALVWRPGQATTVHDHLAWCAVGVHEGREEEIAYDVVEHAGQSCLLRGERQVFGVGAVTSLVPPGDVHVVTNPGPGDAISIHIYGADVRRTGSSIRQRYDLPILEPAEIAAAACARRVAG
jgi:predicted metal-dependent enzyme (double-stranded beta helix superfamily)